MREIKFRGKLKLDYIPGDRESDLVYGYYVRLSGRDFIITEYTAICEFNKKEFLNSDDLLEVEEGSVVQFTGLKDKSGKDIYEGDTLRYNYHIEYDENWKGSRKNEDFSGVVEYHDKILEIGYEHDPTRFVGFILCACKGTEDEYYTTIPKLDDIEIIDVVYTTDETEAKK